MIFETVLHSYEMKIIILLKSYSSTFTNSNTIPLEAFLLSATIISMYRILWSRHHLLNVKCTLINTVETTSVIVILFPVIIKNNMSQVIGIHSKVFIFVQRIMIKDTLTSNELALLQKKKVTVIFVKLMFAKRWQSYYELKAYSNRQDK